MRATPTVGQAAGERAGFWLLWRYLWVDRFAVRSSNPCRHGRACPGHPRRAAAMRATPTVGQAAGERDGFWLLWRYLLVDRFAVRSSNLAVMAGLVPAIHAGPPQETRSGSRRPRAAFGLYGVMCWSTGLLFVRRTLAVMAGLVPAIHAGPPQERVPASARRAGRRTVARLFALACVDALGLRGWPGQARP